MTQRISRLLFAPTLMVAFAVLIKGYVGAGDGFAAGIIAGMAFAMQFVAVGERNVRRRLHTKYAPVVAMCGLALALACTFLPVLRGLPLLTHWPPPGAQVLHFGTVEILTAVAFDVGVFLLVLGFTVTALALVSRAESREQLQP
ncbi:MAG: sodium:proton antiporter [Chloroflexota bacterium]|nr:sodium:proton antiporter [Chloroflexota bacterium]